jgi:predicted DNA-binding transcriptional regulator AlpA
MEYDFTLKFKLSDTDCNADSIVERLGAEGCDDALVGIGTPGRIALTFTRNAESARAAILSALSDVKHAIPSAKLVEVGPDFVGITDVAEVVGVSRQSIRKLMVSNAATFPPAVHDGSASIWHLALVLQWLQSRASYQIAQDVLDVARMAMQVNIAREAELLPPDLHQEMRELVA